jgi:hypothetical protein
MGHTGDCARGCRAAKAAASFGLPCFALGTSIFLCFPQFRASLDA